MKLNLNGVKTYANLKTVFKVEDQPFDVSEAEGKALMSVKNPDNGEPYFVQATGGEKKTLTIGKKDAPAEGGEATKAGEADKGEGDKGDGSTVTL